MALESNNPVTSIYETGTSNDEDSQSMIEKISTNIDEQTLITNKIAIIQLMENLKDKERQVILLRYYRNKTQTEVAEILGTSQVQVSRLEKRALQNMKKILTEDLVLK